MSYLWWLNNFPPAVEMIVYFPASHTILFINPGFREFRISPITKMFLTNRVCDEWFGFAMIFFLEHLPPETFKWWYAQPLKVIESNIHHFHHEQWNSQLCFPGLCFNRIPVIMDVARSMARSLGGWESCVYIQLKQLSVCRSTSNCLDIPAQPKVSRYLWCRKLVVNNGINYQPQLVSDSRSSEPSTVSLKKSHKKLGVTGEPWGFLGKIGDGTLGKIRGISTPPSESD